MALSGPGGDPVAVDRSLAPWGLPMTPLTASAGASATDWPKKPIDARRGRRRDIQDIDRCMSLCANFPQTICPALHELTLPARFRETMAEWSAPAGGACLAQHLWIFVGIIPVVVCGHDVRQR